jgi:hypothetical protein
MSNISDEDDDEEELEVEQDILTRDGIWTHIDASSNGQKSLDIIDLLPNFAQCYGYSLTMNAIIKISSRHPVFCDICSLFFSLSNTRMEKM